MGGLSKFACNITKDWKLRDTKCKRTLIDMRPGKFGLVDMEAAMKMDADKSKAKGEPINSGLYTHWKLDHDVIADIDGFMRIRPKMASVVKMKDLKEDDVAKGGLEFIGRAESNTKNLTLAQMWPNYKNRVEPKEPLSEEHLNNFFKNASKAEEKYYKTDLNIGAEYFQNLVDLNSIRNGLHILKEKHQCKYKEEILVGICSYVCLIGDTGTCSAYHVEDSRLASLNILLYGEPAMWIFIEVEDNERVIQLIKDITKLDCDGILESKRFALSPERLAEAGIKFRTVIQYPNEALLIYPNVVHFAYNTSFNIKISMNVLTSEMSEIVGSKRKFCKCIWHEKDCRNQDSFRWERGCSSSGCVVPDWKGKKGELVTELLHENILHDMVLGPEEILNQFRKEIYDAGVVKRVKYTSAKASVMEKYSANQMPSTSASCSVKKIKKDPTLSNLGFCEKCNKIVNHLFMHSKMHEPKVPCEKCGKMLAKTSLAKHKCGERG